MYGGWTSPAAGGEQISYPPKERMRAGLEGYEEPVDGKGVG